MTRIGWRGLLARCLLAGGLAGGVGCTAFLHPVPTHEMAEPCLAVPRAARCQVHVFLLDGLDPLGLCDLYAVKNYLNCLGFPRTYHGQCYHAVHFAGEIRRIKKEEPEARVVIVGTRLGAYAAEMMAADLIKSGVHPDLVIEMNASAETVACQACEMTSTDYVTYLGSPGDPATLHALSMMLASVAGTVPVVIDVPAGQPEQLPAPRPAETKPLTNGWELLRPSPQLRSGPAMEGVMLQPLGGPAPEPPALPAAQLKFATEQEAPAPR